MSEKKASFSIPSLLAIVAAILSFNVGAIGGLLLAAVAFIFGALGIVLALSPKTRGGGLSILAVLLSFIGVIAAIIKAIMWLMSLG
ncbi:MAG: hypothetical protein NWT08_04945 [Akkermansiaceae bacterium]|jgi:hypothetical protein|nr:hypothetical protein [Akkermansiaceae bacterium]MDP4721389.1 hypothetical protein [Akkermansiaceae bacterium]MDP4779390.1 hypothetical protein [Akkermansiaceae bacterium]MDP4897067.1 hypothetical protein [Akkermansiaceae bacterium]